ncbi:MAG: cupredoxin domain-containing protein [Microcystaceae cyanobacterium]
MKYISYLFMAIASAFLVILLSLSSCRPTSQTMPPQPSVMEHPPTTQPQTPTSQAQAQPQRSLQAATATVKIRNFKFEPATVTIAVGETVQFINVDEEPHTATSTDGTFNSKALDTNQTWNYTATKPGTFPYICSIHPFMKGTLTVTPKRN